MIIDAGKSGGVMAQYLLRTGAVDEMAVEGDGDAFSALFRQGTEKDKTLQDIVFGVGTRITHGEHGSRNNDRPRKSRRKKERAEAEYAMVSVP